MYYGENAVKGLANLEGTRKKAFIVMSGDILEKLGSLKLVTTVLEEAGFEWTTYTDVEPEPSFNTIMKGVGFMTEFNPDWIIGFGGGSAMDAAKAMWVFYENPDCKELDDVMPPKIIKNLKVKARIACIPTSAGTGSEATRAALIKDTVKKRKYSIRDMNGRMVPDVAILDPVFTASMPKSLIAASGMDAITHAIESFVTPNANPFSDAMAMASFINGYNNIVMAYEEADNTEAKSRMLAASCMGGIAFSNGGLGIVHSIAHTFGAEYGVPHGLANAIVLPYGLEYNGKSTEVLNKYKELARLVGETSLLEGIRKINRKINIPYCMKEVVKEEEDVLNKMDELVEKAMSDICTSFTPVKPTKEELKELILKVYYGN